MQSEADEHGAPLIGTVISHNFNHASLSSTVLDPRSLGVECVGPASVCRI